jgi:hypothetical protein
VGTTRDGSENLPSRKAHGPTSHRKAIATIRSPSGPYLYRARNLVARFFNRIKQCRRVATRYDKLAANYLAFVQLASIRLWLAARYLALVGYMPDKWRRLVEAGSWLDASRDRFRQLTHEIRSLACCRRSWSRTAARSKPAPRSAASPSSEAESIDHHL